MLVSIGDIIMIGMSEKEIQEFVDILYPHFLKRLRDDGNFKNNVKSKNATVVSESVEDGGSVTVRLPYDTATFAVPNKTGVTLVAGNTVCLLNWID